MTPKEQVKAEIANRRTGNKDVPLPKSQGKTLMASVLANIGETPLPVPTAPEAGEVEETQAQKITILNARVVVLEAENSRLKERNQKLVEELAAVRASLASTAAKQVGKSK